MAETTPDFVLLSVSAEKKPESRNLFRKAKEEAKAVLENAKEHADELIKDLDEKTGGITAPNMFKAAKKEMKAALRTGRTRLLHKLARRKTKDGDDIEDVEGSETSEEEEEEEEVDGTTAVDSEAVVEEAHLKTEPQDKRNQSNGAEFRNGESGNGDKKHQQIESAKEEIKAIVHHEKPAYYHHETATYVEATESAKEDIGVAAQHEKSDNHHSQQRKEENGALGKKEPDEDKSIQSLQRKWGFMQCVGELLEKACSPK